MDIVTLDQVCEEAVKMQVNDERTFTVNKFPKGFQSFMLSAKLVKETHRTFSVRRSGTTLHVHCFNHQ